MVRIEGEIDIDRPVDDVFDVVADPCAEPRYNPGMLRVDKLDPGPVQAGSRFRNVARAMGTSGAMELVITGIERPHRFAGTVVFHAFAGQAHHYVVQLEGGRELEVVTAGSEMTVARGAAVHVDWAPEDVILLAEADR